MHPSMAKTKHAGDKPDTLKRPVPARPGRQRIPMLEKRLEDVTRLVSDWIWEIDAERRFTFVSHRVADILGMHPMSILGRKFNELGRFCGSHGTDGEPDWTQPFCDLEFEAIAEDSEIRSLQVSGMPQFDGATGAFSGVCGTARDVTERRRAEAELDRQRTMFESLFHDAPDAMAVIGVRGRIVMCNPAFCKMSGRRPDQVIGKSTLLLYATPGECRRHRNFLREHSRDTESRHFIGRFRRLSGEVFSGELLTSEMTDRQGTVIAYVHVLRDVTERDQAEAALRESEERFRNLVEGAVRGIVIAADGRPLFANRAYAQTFGYDKPEEILELESLDILYLASERDRVRGYRQNRARGLPAPQQFEVQCTCKDGSIIWIDCLLRAVNWNGERAVQSTIVDITQRKHTEEALRASEARLSAVIDNAPVAIALKNPDGRFVMVGKQFETWLGLNDGAAIGKTAHELLPPWQADLLTDGDQGVVESGVAIQKEFEVTLSDGDMHTILSSKFPIPGPEGKAVAVGVVNIDITQHKRAEQELGMVQEELLRKANFDDLTGLPNRVLFLDRLSQTVLRGRRDRDIAAVLIIDLDNFKNVNDTLGHIVGDQILLQTAHRLQSCVRDEDTVARIGGDEFTVILPTISSGDDAAVVAANIVQIFNHPFLIDGQEFVVTASVGITLYPEDGDTPENLVKNADAAMYSAKALGRNAYRFFTPEINDKALQQMRMETLLRQALIRD